MDSILDLIGNTPILRLKRIEEKHQLCARIFAKLEYLNPFGSIKDRVGDQMISDAESMGYITKGTRIIEATSGNLGIALAAICNVKGYKCHIVAPQNIHQQRLKIMQSYGAEVLLSSEKGGMHEAITEAKYLSETLSNCFYTNQFENYSSVVAHFRGTAPEIEHQLSAHPDIIICGVGSGGTLEGLHKYFLNKNTDIIGVLPANHPHKIAGIGAGFIPKIVNPDHLDNSIYIDDSEIDPMIREANELMGISIGISSAAVLCAGLKIGKEKRYKDKNIVLIFADSGERYI